LSSELSIFVSRIKLSTLTETKSNFR